MSNKYQKKFDRMMMDPFNKLIPRRDDAGTIDGSGNIIMNSGVKVIPFCYCKEFTELFVLNKGVHEPSEEYIFELIINKIKQTTTNPTMVEFGSYWAYYSMWFQKVTNGINYCVEPNIHKLEMGKRNFEINKMTAEFLHSKVGPSKKRQFINIDKLMKLYKLDRITLVHADIQKAEVDLLEGSVESLSNQLVDYLFINTHSIPIHNQCYEMIKDYGYNIIAEGNENETYFFDGLIVACRNNIDFEYIEIKM